MGFRADKPKCAVCGLEDSKVHRCYGMPVDKSDPYYKYWRGKWRNESRRNVKWNITGPELVRIFEEKGITPADIGNQPHQYNLGRIDHSKDYTVDNVRLETQSENSSEACTRGQMWLRRKNLTSDSGSL